MEGKKQIKVAVVTERPGMCNTEYYYIDADGVDGSETSIETLNEMVLLLPITTKG
jgi:hypothetical protein